MAVTFKDYYSTLGVPRTASLDEIKKAHRKLARQHHPDRNPGDKEAEARFKEIQEAYDVLSDPAKRERYDRLGADWQEGAGFRPGRDGGFRDDEGGFGGEQHGEFSDFFESLFGGGRRGFRGGATFRVRGRDLEVEAPISLEEAHRGTTRTLSLTSTEPCPECGGTGERDDKVCDACHGAGARPARKSIEVTIPAGVRDGTVLRLSGQGEPGRGGGPAGDLLVRVHLNPHPRFTLVGEDLLLELPVAPWEPVLGASVPVETLDGTVQLTIPAGSQGGQRLRLRGQGLARRDGGRGDLYVRLEVKVPTRPTPQEKELFERLAAVSSFRPR